MSPVTSGLGFFSSMSQFAFSFTQGKRVEASAELVRIVNIPRREWSPSDAMMIAEELTSILKQPWGTMSLRPIQAIALVELGMSKGLFAPIRVGGGKTLISLLAPLMCGSIRPLLIVPAKLLSKTRRDMRILSQHFRMPLHLRIVSYEKLSHMNNAEYLNRYVPDLIIADEVHKLGNLSASVTAKVVRFMRSHSGCKFVAMSGTITKRSIKDYAHILHWCLKDQSPLPRTTGELQEWADALDEKINPMRRLDPGELIQLCNDQERQDWNNNKLSSARRAYRRRLIETECIIATTETPLDMPLVVTHTESPVVNIIDEAFEQLRAYVLPDGWELIDAMQVWRHARELGLGMFYRWNPRPPDYWYDARKQWASVCRDIIKHSQSLDTEAQVAQAIVEGDITCSEYWAWKQVEPDFTPNTEAVWLDESVLHHCAKWMRKGPGIVWVEHTFFGERLSQLTGAPYYGEGGLDKQGRYIESGDPKQCIIASIESNYEGRNLQVLWSRNLIVSPPPNGRRWEQMLGRTHRDGQMADEVEVEVVITCLEHLTAFWQSHKDSQYTQDTQGTPMKLLLADISVPSLEDYLLDRTHLARWSKMLDDE